jgi:ribonucleotide reductase beta subunit family protein with ferritin-like domain
MMGNKKKPGPSFWSIVLSTIAAAFGVQSRRNQERDFEHGNIWVYIVSGVLFTAGFVIIVALVVSSVLKSNGL